MKTIFTLAIGAGLALFATKKTDLSNYVCEERSVVVHAAAGFADVEIHAERMADQAARLAEQAAAEWQIEIRQSDAWQSRSEELVLERQFDVREGDELVVDVADADIQIRTGDTEVAHVQVFLAGRNMDRAREYFENLEFRITRSGEQVVVATNNQRARHWDWRKSGGAQIRVVAEIPTTFDLDIKTSDGDISSENIRGTVNIRTSDGDVALGAVEGGVVTVQTSDGDVAAGSLFGTTVSVKTSDGDLRIEEVSSTNNSLQTSDGDVRIRTISGPTVLRTSDGDISVEDARGATMEIKTSDGDITIAGLSAQRSSIRSSDGGIHIGRFEGSLEAITSSGDINVQMTKAGDVELRTSDGDVNVRAPGSLTADLALQGEAVRVASTFDFDGTIKKNLADGTINGGGPRLVVRASDGTVTLSSN